MLMHKATVRGYALQVDIFVKKFLSKGEGKLHTLFSGGIH